MQVRELGHVVLYVRNLERSVHFYRDVLGFRQVLPADGKAPFIGAAAFSSGRTHHELLLIEVGDDAAAVPEGRRVGLYHIGLKIGDSDEDLREALERLRQSDARLIGASDHTVTHSLYLLDPDGNELELFVDVAGVDWKEHPELLGEPVRPLRI